MNYSSPYQSEISGRPALKERQRRRIVEAVFGLFILTLLEGVLRKWVTPELARPLIVLRDPFAVLLYGYALHAGFLRSRGLAGVWLGFAAVTSLIGAGQYITADHGLAGFLLGVRTYWLYLPIAFVVASTFREEDFIRFLKLNLWISLLYAPLVALQYNAPPTSFLNRGVAGDNTGAILVAYDIIRPFGVFTFTAPNVQYTTVVLAMYIAMALSGRLSPLLILIFGLSVSTMAVLTGSRAIVFTGGAMVVMVLMALLMLRPRWRALRHGMFLAGFVLAAMLLLVLLHPDMFAAIVQRFELAGRSEGHIYNRLAYETISAAPALLDAPATGYGIGAGAPGVARFLGLPPLIYGEPDLVRHINELGPFMGVLMILLRWATAAFVLRSALRASLRGNFQVLPIAGFLIVPLLVGSFTQSPLISYWIWMMLGLFLAMIKTQRPQTP